MFRRDRPALVRCGRETFPRRMLGGESVAGFNEVFSYDPIGNRVSSTDYDETGAARTSTYTANNLNQYTSRTVPGYAAVRGHADADATVTVNENATYRYGEYFFGGDELDNTSSPVNAMLETVAVKPGATEDEPDEIASVTNSVYLAKSPVAYEYDEDGNQTLVATKTGLWRVTYNGENRPVRWERLNSSTPNSNTPSLITMTFDHQGRRREYLEVAANGMTNSLKHFTYDNYIQIANCNLQLATGNLQLVVWDPTEPVATRPLAFYQPNASPQLYAHDGNKNVSELVSVNNGTITAHYEYSSFGEVILSSGDLSLANPFRFSSEYADDALGLVYYNYRHLESVIGRWLQRDMIEEEGGVALYGICLNRIIESVDYLGRLSCCRCTYIGNMFSPGQSTGFSYQGGQHCFYLSEGSIIEVNLEFGCESRFWGFGACDNKKCLVRTRYRCQKFQSAYFWVYLTDRVFPCSEK